MVATRRRRIDIAPALVTHAGKETDFCRNSRTTRPGVAGSVLWGTKAEYLCHVLPPLTWRPSDSLATSSDFAASCENHSVQVGKPRRYQNLNASCHLVGGCDETVAKEVPSAAVLDLDEPEIRIEPGFPREKFVSLRDVDRGRSEWGDPPAIAFRAIESSGRRSEDEAAPVEAVDLDEDGAGVVVAVAHHDGRRALDGTTADIGFHPEFSAQSHGRHSSRPAHAGKAALRRGRNPALAGQARKPGDQRTRDATGLGERLVAFEGADGA